MTHMNVKQDPKALDAAEVEAIIDAKVAEIDKRYRGADRRAQEGMGYAINRLSEVRDSIRRLSNITTEAASAAAEPVCSVKTMKLSDGREEHYVSIMVGNREITPYRFTIKGRAEFEVANFQWLLNGAEKPDMMDWLDRTAGPEPATNPPAETPTIRVCPERDARCPHGLDCPYWIDRGRCDMAGSRAALQSRAT